MERANLALIIGGLVVFGALLLSFVSLLQGQVERGESLRQAQRAGLYAVREGRVLIPAQESRADSAQVIASTAPR